MGGHGGLNILPQKRWNVYNQDNREKVERDVKQHEEKMRQERIRQEQDQADVRYEILKTRKQQRQREERGDNEDRPKSSLNDELKALMPERFNLFEREEEDYMKKRRQEKNEEYEREKKMKEDRFVEQTTCYLGQTVKKSMPWYCQSAPTEESIANQKSENSWPKSRGRNRDREDRRSRKEEKPNSIFKVPEDNYYQVLDLDSLKDKKGGSKAEPGKEHGDIKEKVRENSNEKDRRSREKSREKERKKKDKKDKKEKKEKKHKKHHRKHKGERKNSIEGSLSKSRSRSRSKSQEKEDKEKERDEQRLKEEKLAKLRAERLRREQAEKKKTEKLIKEHYPIGKNTTELDSYYYFN